MNSFAISWRRSCSGSLSMPKFWDARSSDEVTMFQPMRPRVRWSSVANWRAGRYGLSNVVDAVQMMPMCSVAWASVDAATTGSSFGA
nr:hypothetical protein [Frondihabitans sp. PAMC 28766]